MPSYWKRQRFTTICSRWAKLIASVCPKRSVKTPVVFTAAKSIKFDGFSPDELNYHIKSNIILYSLNRTELTLVYRRYGRLLAKSPGQSDE